MVTVLEAEIENLDRFMAQLEGSMAVSRPPTSLFASTKSGTYAIAFHISPSTSSSWIIDSGASDHMIGLSSLLSSYSICSNCDKVRVTNERLSSIYGKWSVNVSPTMSLSLVLHVFKLATNLLSISYITCDLNCLVTFFPSHCVFRTSIWGRWLRVVV